MAWFSLKRCELEIVLKVVFSVVDWFIEYTANMHRVSRKYANPGVVVEVGNVMMLMPEVLSLTAEEMPTSEEQYQQAVEKLRKLNTFIPDPQSFLIQAYMKSGKLLCIFLSMKTRLPNCS